MSDSVTPAAIAWCDRNPDVKDRTSRAILADIFPYGGYGRPETIKVYRALRARGYQARYIREMAETVWDGPRWAKPVIPATEAFNRILTWLWENVHEYCRVFDPDKPHWELSPSHVTYRALGIPKTSVSGSHRRVMSQVLEMVGWEKVRDWDRQYWIFDLRGCDQDQYMENLRVLLEDSGVLSSVLDTGSVEK